MAAPNLGSAARRLLGGASKECDVMSNNQRAKRQAAAADSAEPPAATVQGEEQLRQEIELRAYYRYCERGCAPGADREDWLAAEQELLAQRASGAVTTS